MALSSACVVNVVNFVSCVNSAQSVFFFPSRCNLHKLSIINSSVFFSYDYNERMVGVNCLHIFFTLLIFYDIFLSVSPLVRRTYSILGTHFLHK